MSIDAPRRLARAAGDEAFRGTPFRRDKNKLLWVARYGDVTVALDFQRSTWGPRFFTNVGAHVDGIVLPYAFNPRDVTTYVLYTRLRSLVTTYEEALMNFNREMPEDERRNAIVTELRKQALPLLARCSTREGMRGIAAEQPEESGWGQRLRWFLGVGPRPDWMSWNPP